MKSERLVCTCDVRLSFAVGTTTESRFTLSFAVGTTTESRFTLFSSGSTSSFISLLQFS